MRGVLALLVGILAFLGALLAIGARNDPQDVDLDDAARAEAPGLFVAGPEGVTHYDVTGEDTARTVVLIHGFSVPYYIWDSTFVALSREGFRVVRYDLCGRGWSDRPHAAYDGALYVGQLTALLDSLRIGQPVDVMGLSFGGYVASEFAVREPERLRTLTLVDPVSSTSEVPSTLRLPILGEWIWNTTRVPDMAEGQRSDFLHPERYPTWVDQYRPQMRYRGFGRSLLATRIAMADISMDSLYDAVGDTGLPVLLVWGKQDNTVPIELSDVARRNIPGIRYEPIDSAGHLPHIEQSAVVNPILLEFLRAH